MHIQNVEKLFGWIKTKKHIVESYDAMIIRGANGLIAHAKLAEASELHIIQDKNKANYYFKIKERLEQVLVTEDPDVIRSIFERYRTIARLPIEQVGIPQEAFLYYTVDNFRIQPTEEPRIQLNFTPNSNGENLIIKFLDN